MTNYTPPTRLDVTDMHGGYTALTPLGTLWRPPTSLDARRRPTDSLPKEEAGKPIGVLTTYHESNYQGMPAIEATYRLPNRGPRAVVWFTEEGERIA